jgi:PAS domain S-box-containing protein
VVDARIQRFKHKQADKLRETIFLISQACNATEGLDELFSAIHEIIGKLILAENFFVALLEHENKIIRFPYYVDQKKDQPKPRSFGRGLTEYVIRTETPLLATRDVMDQLVGEGEIELKGIRAIDWLGVPLKSQNRIFGAMVLKSYSPHKRIGNNEKEILSFVSTQSAIAIGRKLAEEALIFSESRYRFLFEESPIFSSILGPDGTIVDANKFTLNFLGYSRDEFVGKNAFDFIDVEMKDAVLERMLFEFRGGVSDEGIEFGIIGKDGNQRQMLFTQGSGKLFDREGKPILLVIGIDLTELKKAKADLKSNHQKLAVVNREIDSFVNTVSHELKAPLRHIQGFSQLLVEKYSHQLDTEACQYIDYIVNGTTRIQELLTEILKLSQATSRDLRKIRINISNLVKGITRTIRNTDGVRNVQVKIEDDLYVYCDPGLVQTALENLLENAWKFTRNKENAVIEFGQIIVNDEDVFFLRDNGVGFSQDVAPKLFFSFKRFHASEEFEGTGIGLATVQRIIHRHGGRIWAKGEVGKGATFYFTLPETNSDME